jgi:hypothetical protein
LRSSEPRRSSASFIGKFIQLNYTDHYAGSQGSLKTYVETPSREKKRGTVGALRIETSREDFLIPQWKKSGSGRAGRAEGWAVGRERERDDRPPNILASTRRLSALTSAMTRKARERPAYPRKELRNNLVARSHNARPVGAIIAGESSEGGGGGGHRGRFREPSPIYTPVARIKDCELLARAPTPRTCRVELRRPRQDDKSGCPGCRRDCHHELRPRAPSPSSVLASIGTSSMTTTDLRARHYYALLERAGSRGRVPRYRDISRDPVRT